MTADLTTAKQFGHCLTLSSCFFFLALLSSDHSRTSSGRPCRVKLPTWSRISATLSGLLGLVRIDLIDCWMCSVSDLVGRISTTQSQSGTSKPSPNKSTLQRTVTSPRRNPSTAACLCACGVVPSRCIAFIPCSLKAVAVPSLVAIDEQYTMVCLPLASCSQFSTALPKMARLFIRASTSALS